MLNKLLFHKATTKPFYWVLLVIILFPFRLSAQNYNQTIYLPSQHSDKEVLDCVTDMAYSLQKASGKPVAIKDKFPAEGISGIRLLLVNQSDLSSNIKKQLSKDGQSFYLIIKGTHSAQIIGTGKNSFINGIYTFLQELGFRWYMPGDTWTIIPTSLPQININKLYQPDFQNRSYFGTGGVSPVADIDPKNTFLEDYLLWNQRNRFSSDFRSKGHVGEAFYSANKRELEQNPSYFCDGKVNPYGRIDISKAGAVNLFVKWALEQVKPDDPFPCINVDPTDGSGGKDDCLPTSMPDIKTWSDKYFWMANKVGERLKKNDETTKVLLYGYSSHAAPPGFALQKNVYPIIIPYAFQYVSTPQEFIKLWHKKLDGRPMGLYDYWNITQWSVGVPQFNIYEIPKKLRFWKKYNITTINLESINAKGPMGHALWLSSQMMWNTRLSFDSLYNDFLVKCFGPAAVDLKRMYDRWSTNYQNKMEVNLSLNDLALASSRTKDVAILNRITELKAYIHYLKLYYDYKGSGSAEDYEKLINYLHFIHPLRLVQTSALQNYYIPKPAQPKIDNKGASKNAPKALIMSNIYEQIEQQFKKDKEENKFNYQLSSFDFKIQKAKAPDISEKEANPLYLNGPNYYQFYIPVKKVFQIKAGTLVDTRLKILDSLQNLVLDQVIVASKEGYTTVSVKLPAGSYSLIFGEFARYSRLIFPKETVFVTNAQSWYDNAGFPLQYVYVPKDVSEIVYYDEHGPGINDRGFWLTPDGKKLNSEKVSKTIYRVPVAQQYRGKVWVLNIGHPSFRLLNIPNILSLRKFQYVEN